LGAPGASAATAARVLGSNNAGLSVNIHAAFPFSSAVVPFASDTCGSPVDRALGLRSRVKHPGSVADSWAGHGRRQAFAGICTASALACDCCTVFVVRAALHGQACLNVTSTCRRCRCDAPIRVLSSNAAGHSPRCQVPSGWKGGPYTVSQTSCQASACQSGCH